MKHKKIPMKTANILSLMVSMWLLISPGILRNSNTLAQTNDIHMGFIIGIVSLLRMVLQKTSTLLILLPIFAGIWLFISPFVLAYTSNNQRLNDIIVGLIIVFLALWDSIITSQEKYVRKGI